MNLVRIYDGVAKPDYPPGLRFRILAGDGEMREVAVVPAGEMSVWVDGAFERGGEAIPFYHDDPSRDGGAVLLDLKGQPNVPCESLLEAYQVALETLWQMDVRLEPLPGRRRKS